MDWMRNESISPVCDDHVKFENIHIFGNGAFIHGIFVQRQSFVKISFCQVLSCLGSGVFIDRTYDSAFEKLTVLHCGRMVGSTESEAYEKGYGIDKQLYALIHITKSSGDNCNYLVFRDLHVELNDNCIADIIVTGDSSPIVFDTIHFECGGNIKYASGLKQLFRIGEKSGVDCFAVENIPNYDSENPPLNGGGGWVLANHINGTLAGYQYGVNLSGYGNIYIDDSSLPNGIDNIIINTNNNSASLEAIHCGIGNIEITGGNASTYPIRLYSCGVGNINGSYMQSMILSDVACGDIYLSNLSTINERAKPISFKNVSANSLSVINSNLLAIGDISFSSSLNPFATLEVGSDLKVTYSGYIANNFVEY